MALMRLSCGPTDMHTSSQASSTPSTTYLLARPLTATRDVSVKAGLGCFQMESTLWLCGQSPLPTSSKETSTPAMTSQLIRRALATLGQSVETGLSCHLPTMLILSWCCLMARQTSSRELITSNMTWLRTRRIQAILNQ